jgi:hypothetical protein
MTMAYRVRTRRGRWPARRVTGLVAMYGSNHAAVVSDLDDLAAGRLAIIRPAEPVRRSAERIALGVGEHLGGRDREHHRLAAAILAAEASVASSELPPPIPFGGERPGDAAEHGIVGHLNRVALDHDIQPPVPSVCSRWSAPRAG